jgi:hypothetical protein
LKTTTGITLFAEQAKINQVFLISSAERAMLFTEICGKTETAGENTAASMTDWMGRFGEAPLVKTIT